MSEVRLDLLFNASDALRAIDEIEARLAKLQGLKINVGDLSSVTAAVQNLVNKINELRRPIDLRINTSQIATASSQLSNVAKQIREAFTTATIGVTTQTKTVSTPSTSRSLTFPAVGGLYMFSNVLNRFASRLSSIFDNALSVFEEAATSIQKARIVSGAGPSEFNNFVAELRRLSSRVMTPYPELAQIAYSFATRGYANLRTAPQVIEPLAVASIITGESLDTMARSILSLMQAWNPRELTELRDLAPMLTKQFADMMSYAFAKSPLEVRWFKDIANYAAPLFAQLGYSPQETMAFFMAMSQQIPTPGIGARSSRMLLFNIHDIEKSFKLFANYGIDAAKIFQETAERGGSLADAFRELYGALSQLPKDQLTSVFKQLGGGVRGGMAAMMLNQGDLLTNIENYINALERRSIGYTNYVRTQYRATPKGALESAEAHLTAVLDELGNAVAGAKAAFVELQAGILEFLNNLPSPIVGGLFGAGQGAKWASNWIVEPATNLALLSYLIKSLGFTKLAGGLGIAGGAVLGLGAAFGAYKTYQIQLETERTQKFLEAYKGMPYVEAALDALKNAKYVGRYVEGKPPDWFKFIPLEFRGAAMAMYNSFVSQKGYIVQTPEGERFVPEEKYKDFLSGLGNIGTLLGHAITVQYDKIQAASGTQAAEAFKTTAEEVSQYTQKYFSGVLSNLGVAPEDYGKIDILTRWFTTAGFPAGQVSSLSSAMANIYKQIETQYPGKLEPGDIGKMIQSIIGAGVIEKVTGIKGLTEFVSKSLGIKIDFESLRPLIERIAQGVQSIDSKTDQTGREKFRQYSYGQLLEYWLQGYIPRPELTNMLPALGGGGWPIERTWTPGKYRETVTVDLGVLDLTQPVTLTSAYWDAALKPQPWFN